MGSRPLQIVLASRNPDKVRELKQLCADLPLEVLSAADFPGMPDVVEDGTTIEGNASRKAVATAAFTGKIAVADDTSLQVRELNGLPDIFAARFSGPGATYASNAELVLRLLQDVPENSRQARFATACVWVDPRPGQHRPVQNKSGGQALPGLAPAWNRWLHNPFAAGRDLPSDLDEGDYWNRWLDRSEVWARYRASILADLVSWGHDRAQLAGIAGSLLAGADPGYADEGWIRLPDLRIWAAGNPDDPETAAPPLPEFRPSGLPADAQGPGVCEKMWLEITASGRLLGKITRQAVGGSGFGYDPVFRPEGQEATLAEMEARTKNVLSHRGRALRRLLQAARKVYGF